MRRWLRAGIEPQCDGDSSAGDRLKHKSNGDPERPTTEKPKDRWVAVPRSAARCRQGTALVVPFGDALIVAGRRGSVVLHARRDDGTPPGTVFIAFAYAEAAANRPTHPALDAAAKIAGFKFCAVHVTPGGAVVAPAGCGAGVVCA